MTTLGMLYREALAVFIKTVGNGLNYDLHRF